MSDPKKISVCTEYNFVGPEEKCRVAPRTDMEICRTIMVQENESVCSDPENNLEVAQQALNLRLLHLGRLHQAFKEEENARTVKICGHVAWDRRGRLVTTSGKGNQEETLPLIHREEREVCGEAKNLDEAQKKWEEEAVQFVKSYPYRQYRDPHFQKTAEEAKNSIDWNRVITENKSRKFF